ncbi:dihydroorotase family protein, partial [Candidatus Woesearchaeota archaeon]|nr:dihydroorotase family protein [Candidatus Woesearchaeota archaeon]
MMMISSGSMLLEGDYVTPEGRVEHGQIRVVDGKIEAVGPVLGKPDVSYGKDLLIYPGFIDIHVHAREYPRPPESRPDDVAVWRRQLMKEDFTNMCHTAVAGGVVAFAAMPNDPAPYAPTTRELYDAKKELAARECYIDHVVYALLEPDSVPFEGTGVPYKLYTHDVSIGQMRRVFQNFAGSGCLIALHCENRKIISDSPTRPESAEIRDVSAVLDLSASYSVPVHIAHVSTGKSLELIVQAKKSGVQVTCETTPTYLLLSEERVKNLPNSGIITMKPPLRSEEDRLMLLNGLLLGKIDCLATDHAPHTLEDKNVGAFGIPLEDHYTNVVGWLLQNRVGRDRIVKMCCEFPGKFMERY